MRTFDRVVAAYYLGLAALWLPLAISEPLHDAAGRFCAYATCGLALARLGWPQLDRRFRQ